MTPLARRILLTTLALRAAVAGADSLTLRDGSVVAGVVKQVGGGYDVTLEGGKHRFVATEEVKTVKLSNEGKVTEANAQERLQSLQRSIENDRDLDRVIDRFEQFVKMNAGTEAAKLAQADLEVWRDRKAKGMLKVGHRWLTVAERDAALIEAAKLVDRVCALIASDDLDAAARLLREASGEDPDNVSYLYLNGVLQLRREQFFDAKRSFDAVATIAPEHPPTLVNLAVLAVQFRRWPQAVTLLEQAMTLAPGSQQILDDVIELRQLAPESTRRTGSFERLEKRAAPLEAALEDRQAKRGLYRLGSQWVDQAAIDAAKAALDAFEKKKADLEADYQGSQELIRKADEQIGLTQRMIQRIEADAVVQDANGNVIRRGYPPAYWDLQRDLDLLQNQRKGYTDHIVALRKQADAVKANAPRPPFAGKLSPIDQRGVPVVLPAGTPTRATAEPATAPSIEPTGAPTSKPAPLPEATAPASTTNPASGLFD